MAQTAVRAQIKANSEEFRSDSDTQAAMGKLDVSAFRQDVSKCQEHLTTLINFQNYKGSLQQLKAQQGTLDPQTEKDFAIRSEGMVAAYRSFVGSARNVAHNFSRSGLDKPLERHAKGLFWQLPLSPDYPQLTQKLQSMGMNDSDISRHAAALKGNDWDILSIHGTDGTFSALVESAAGQMPVLEKMHSAVMAHGLAVIEGHGGGDGGTDYVPIIIAIFVILNAIDQAHQDYINQHS